jgi:hypothetical protein
MIKGRLFIIAVTALLFSSCFNNSSKPGKPDITTDTLTYAYQTIREHAADCGDKPDTNCTIAQIKYPVIVNNEALNDTLSHNMLKLFDGDPDKGLQTLAKSFITSYDGWKKAHKDAKARFKLNINTSVLRQDSDLITLQISGTSLAGNKHPIALTRFINWNTKTQKTILLDSILISGYKEPLSAIAEKIFRKQENLTDTSSLTRDYFFKGGKFALTGNFLITPLGIRFLYNQYEIKPYNAGTTNLFIPYGQISQLLKPNTVTTQYHKIEGHTL